MPAHLVSFVLSAGIPLVLQMLVLHGLSVKSVEGDAAGTRARLMSPDIETQEGFQPGFPIPFAWELGPYIHPKVSRSLCEDAREPGVRCLCEESMLLLLVPEARYSRATHNFPAPWLCPALIYSSPQPSSQPQSKLDAGQWCAEGCPAARGPLRSFMPSWLQNT